MDLTRQVYKVWNAVQSRMEALSVMDREAVAASGGEEMVSRARRDYRRWPSPGVPVSIMRTLATLLVLSSCRSRVTHVWMTLMLLVVLTRWNGKLLASNIHLDQLISFFIS